MSKELVTHAELAAWAERDERTLRLQQPGERLAPRAERTLASAEFQPNTLEGALRRWAYIKHLWYLRSDEAERKEDEAAGTLRALLRREPIVVHLGTRSVPVTGRSYAALAEIAAHATRIRELELDLQRCEGLLAGTAQELAHATRGERAKLRRRFRRLGEVSRALLAETTLHRQALYAHALTPDGAPAASLDDAPAWWREIGIAEDAKLLAATWGVGPGRVNDLPPQPTSEDREGSGGADYGWAAIFAGVERTQRIEPAALFNRDLYQLTAWLRASAAPAPEELEG